MLSAQHVQTPILSPKYPKIIFRYEYYITFNRSINIFLKTFSWL